jgi:transposase
VEEHGGVAKAELSCEADSENYSRRLLRDIMYYIGLDVHKRMISYCVKDAAGKIHQEGKIGSTRRELDAWCRAALKSRTVALISRIRFLRSSSAI